MNVLALLTLQSTAIVAAFAIHAVRAVVARLALHTAGAFLMLRVELI